MALGEQAGGEYRANEPLVHTGIGRRGAVNGSIIRNDPGADG
jgi:hypothetical protein